MEFNSGFKGLMRSTNVTAYCFRHWHKTCKCSYLFQQHPTGFIYAHMIERVGWSSWNYGGRV